MQHQGCLRFYSSPIICGLGLFLAGYVFYSSALIENLFSRELQLIAWQIGSTQAAIPLGAILGALLVGRMADRWGRRRILVLNFLLLGLLSGLAFFVMNLYTLCIARFLHGFLAGALYPLCATYLTETVAQHKHAKLTAILMFINCLAAPVACILFKGFSLFCNDYYLWRIMMACLAIPCFIAFGFARSLSESHAWQAQQLTQALEQHTVFYHWQKMFSPKYRNLSISLIGCWFLMDVAYYGINFFVPYLLAMIQKNIAAGDVIHLQTLLIDIFFLLGAFSAIFVVDKCNLIRLQKYGFLIAGLSFMLLASCLLSAFNVNLFIILFLFMLFNFALNIGPDVTTYLLSATSYPVIMRGAAHGLITSIAKIGSFLGVLFLPTMSEMLGCESVLFVIAVLLFLAYGLTNYLPQLSLKPNWLEEAILYEAN